MRFGWLIGLIFLVGCGGQSAPVVISPFPSQTPEVTSSPTRPADAPTVAFTLAPTVTLAPTRAITTANDGPPPTSPLLATFTAEPATQTATFAPQFAGIEIDYFTTTTAGPFAPGDRLTLFWRFSGAPSGRIFRLNSAGQRAQVWDVGSEGRLTVGIEVEDGQTVAQFLLRAEIQDSFAERKLEISLDCPFRWFFVPAPTGCPESNALSNLQVQQNFEHGLMLWLESEQQIYVLFEDGNAPTWQVFQDLYTEGMPEGGDTPPASHLIAPVRGFGLVWRENPTVQTRLGWAIDAETGYDGLIQRSGGALYLRGRGGDILALQPNGASWETLPETSETPLPDVTAEAIEASATP